MRESFVFYKSFRDILEVFEDPEDWRELLSGVFAYAFDGKDVSFADAALQIAFTHFKVAIDASTARYDKAVENGQHGGRPRKWVNQSEAEMLYEDLKSWKKVAEELDVSSETLRKARLAWNAKKPKNLNDNVNDNANVNVALLLTNKEEPRQPAAGPSGPPSVTAQKELRPPPLPIPTLEDDKGDGIR